MKTLKYIFPFACLIFVTFYSIKAEKNPLDTHSKKLSYAIGRQVGASLKSQDIEELDLNSLTSAISDVLSDKPSLLSDEDIRDVLTKYQEDKMAELKEAAGENKAKGAAFLEENKTKEGVQLTASGLQYLTLTEGTGANPTADQKVNVHYKGTLVDGTEFDSSYKRGEPISFPLKGVIKGWTEGIPLMKLGGKTRFFIPSELAYGEAGRPGIPANSVLIFDVELLAIEE